MLFRLSLKSNYVSLLFMQSSPPKIHNKGKRKTQDPCPVCFLHRDRCICEWIQSLTLKTKLTLVIHNSELRRTTNTGTLAVKALTNSELLVRGKIDEPLDLSQTLSEDYRSLLFYPCEEAIDLSAEFLSQSSLPIHLIVPDGNWRQASKVHYRHKEIEHLPRVMIKAENTETHHLRAESSKEGMATLQAIAHAMGIIEGDAVKDELLKLYNIKLERTLLGRGIVK